MASAASRKSQNNISPPKFVRSNKVTILCRNHILGGCPDFNATIEYKKYDRKTDTWSYQIYGSSQIIQEQDIWMGHLFDGTTRNLLRYEEGVFPRSFNVHTIPNYRPIVQDQMGSRVSENIATNDSRGVSKSMDTFGAFGGSDSLYGDTDMISAQAKPKEVAKAKRPSLWNSSVLCTPNELKQDTHPAAFRKGDAVYIMDPSQGRLNLVVETIKYEDGGHYGTWLYQMRDDDSDDSGRWYKEHDLRFVH